MSADEKIQSALPTVESDLKHTARNGETDDTEGVLNGVVTVSSDRRVHDGAVALVTPLLT